MVDDVYLNRYMPLEKFPDREEAGTPNISGAIGLAAALYALSRAGMDLVAQEERELIEYALERLATVDNLVIYGETDCSRCERAGAISFNIKKMDHALTASVLNDYFNIAVRNECFCAHPYVREMITDELAEDDDISEEELENLAELHKGMVRASFGVYSTREDVDALLHALGVIGSNRDFYERQYDKLSSGDYEHKTFKFDPARLFSVRTEVDAWLSQNGETDSK
jgi:selenocysteine lyase/cysteine desulfurase